MKDLKGIGFRFTKVVYILLLLFGFVVGWFMWTISTPYQYSTYSYFVECNNGKTFDPTSKPIDRESYAEPYRFSVDQIKSECEYGTAWNVGWSRNLSKNYRSGYREYNHVTGTIQNQIKNTIIAAAIYYILVEVIRRTILYVFLGKKFLQRL